MVKAAFVGIVALVAVGIMPVSADGLVSEGQIAQAKAALRLTPAQERHWPRVAAALRSLNRQALRAESNADSEDDGIVKKVRARASSVVSQAAGARRVMAAAAPLIRTLDSEQKQIAASMASSMGFGHLASRF
jgi:hypothetical protein